MEWWEEKSEGKVEIAVGMYLLVTLMILAAVQLQVRLFGITSAQAEDALAASGLASAVADLKEYGISHMLVIASADNAYAVYKEALQQNLNLNGDGEVPNKDLISGAVKIENYSIYNVREDQVTIYSYGEDGECHAKCGGKRAWKNHGTGWNADRKYLRV